MTTFLAPGPGTDKTGAVVYGLMTKFSAPDKVTDGPMTDLLEAPNLAANFADDRRTYPLHTPAAAWSSAAHYHATGSNDPYVATRIKQAFDYHRLWGEWDRLEKQARSKPVPYVPTHYALPDAKRYPLDTKEQVQKAATYFLSYRDQLESSDRIAYAENLVKRASALAVAFDRPMTKQLEAEAGLTQLAHGWKQAFDVRIALLQKSADEFGPNPFDWINRTGSDYEWMRRNSNNLMRSAGLDGVPPQTRPPIIPTTTPITPAPTSARPGQDMNPSAVPSSSWTDRNFGAVGPGFSHLPTTTPAPVLPSPPGLPGKPATLVRPSPPGLSGKPATLQKSGADDSTSVLIQGLKEASVKPPENIPEAAALLRQIDRVQGWKLTDPLDVLAGDSTIEVREKLAKVVEAADGSWYNREDLRIVSHQTLQDMLGAPMVLSDRWHEDTLRDQTKSASFRQLLQDHGVRPVERAPTQRTDWAALAAST